MFKKLKAKWKSEWLAKHQEEIRNSFERDITTLSEELESMRFEWKGRIQVLEDSMRHRELDLQLKRRQLDELINEVDDKKVTLEQKKAELAQQIKIIEAKSSPSSIWTEAFTLGVSKSWDMILPMMQPNMEKILKKIREDAAIEAIARLKNGNH